MSTSSLKETPILLLTSATYFEIV